MSAISVVEAQRLILRTYNEYLNLLKKHSHREGGFAALALMDLPELERILGRGGSFHRELFEGLKAEDYKQQLLQCHELADLHNLPARQTLARYMPFEIADTVPRIPDGLIRISGDVIICNLKCRDSLQAAMNRLRRSQENTEAFGNWYSMVIASDGESISIVFERWEDLSDFLRLDIEYDKLHRMIMELISDSSSLGSIALKDIAPRLSATLGGIGLGLSVVSVIISLEKFIDNPNWDTGTDLAIDAIGAVPTKQFMLISIGLRFSKRGTIGAINTVRRIGELLYFYNRNSYILAKKLFSFATGGKRLW